MTFSEKLKSMLRQRGWSQLKLSIELDQSEIYGRTIHVSKSKVGDWCKGTYVPNLTEVAALSRVFGVSVDYLVLDEADEPRGPILSEDVRTLVRVYRAIGVSADEAIARLVREGTPAQPPSEEGGPASGVSGTVAGQDFTASRQTKGRSPRKKGS